MRYSDWQIKSVSHDGYILTATAEPTGLQTPNAWSIYYVLEYDVCYLNNNNELVTSHGELQGEPSNPQGAADALELEFEVRAYKDRFEAFPKPEGDIWRTLAIDPDEDYNATYIYDQKTGLYTVEVQNRDKSKTGKALIDNPAPDAGDQTFSWSVNVPGDTWEVNDSNLPDCFAYNLPREVDGKWYVSVHGEFVDPDEDRFPIEYEAEYPLSCTKIDISFDLSAYSNKGWKADSASVISCDGNYNTAQFIVAVDYIESGSNPLSCEFDVINQATDNSVHVAKEGILDASSENDAIPKWRRLLFPRIYMPEDGCYVDVAITAVQQDKHYPFSLKFERDEVTVTGVAIRDPASPTIVKCTLSREVLDDYPDYSEYPDISSSGSDFPYSGPTYSDGGSDFPYSDSTYSDGSSSFARYDSYPDPYYPHSYYPYPPSYDSYPDPYYPPSYYPYPPSYYPYPPSYPYPSEASFPPPDPPIPPPPPQYTEVIVPVYSYQKVETYNPRYYSTGMKHKPTVFSVRLNNTRIPELVMNSEAEDQAERDIKAKLAETLKKDISNTIRDIAKNIAPANTQLFEVYFNDD